MLILILALGAALTSPHTTHAQGGATAADLEALGAKLKSAAASCQKRVKRRFRRISGNRW